MFLVILFLKNLKANFILFIFKRKFKNGFLATQVFYIEKKKDEDLEYKYLMRVQDEKGKSEYFVEYLGKPDLNRTLSFKYLKPGAIFIKIFLSYKNFFNRSLIFN